MKGGLHLGIRLSAALVLWAAFVFAWPVQAEPVTVRTAPHKGYGRIVFNWPAAVPYSAEINGSQLIIRFGRDIEADFGGAVRVLGDYIRSGEIDDDGRTVRFGVTRDFGVRAFDLGNAVVVDLLDQAEPPVSEPRKKAAVPPPQAPATPVSVGPDSSAADGAGNPALGVRTGEHQGYTRVVFDWPRQVGYSVDRSGGQVTITFDRAASPDLRRIQARPPKFIGKVGATLGENELRVSLEIPETSRLRHFRSGSKVALDVMAPAPGETAGAGSTSKPGPKPAQKAAAVPPDTPPDRGTQRQASAESGTPQPAAPEPKQPVAKPTPLIPVQSGGLTPPARLETPSDGPSPATTSATTMVIGQPSDAVTLRFDWSEPVAAAVFRRAGFLWVAFDKAKEVDLDALRAAGGEAIRDIQHMPVENATVLRFDTVSGINPGLRRDGLAWLLDFQKQPMQLQEPIKIQAQPNSPIGARLFLPVPQPGNVIAIPDPEVGDTLVVIPVIPLGHGIAAASEYPQLSFLPTGQGVAVRASIDTLRVRPLRQGIELTSVDHLQISSVSDQAAGTRLTEAKPLTRILDFEKWLNEEGQSFLKRKRHYLQMAALAEGPAKEAARMDVARFFLSQGYGAEALGVLRTLEKDRSGMLNDPEYRALKGGSNFLMGRFEEASEDWYHQSLNDNDEATFWRAALAAREGDTVRASRVLRQTSPILRFYPKALKVPLALIAADVAIDVGDIRQAGQLLDVLRMDNPTRAQAMQIAFVEGRLIELAGDFEGAISKWEGVDLGSHRPSRARALVARTELLLKLKRITRAEAIEDYERLRFTWRGDDFEFALLRRLGRLYLEESDYRNGLRTLRQAVSHFRDHKDSQFVTQEMAEAFSRLYLEGEADALPPVTAIALYDEFRELTPSGGKGDEMVRKLADRLVAVDLLDRGATLLDEQVEFRLNGVEKSRVGAQLALIRIMDNQAEKALSALNKSTGAGLPENLRVKRRHLRARALIQLGQAKSAIELLDEDETADAERLRAEIFWTEQDWPKAAQILGRLIRATGVKPKQDLTEKQALMVLNYAIALTLSDNERGVSRVHEDFGVPMDMTAYRDAFRLITAPQTAGAINSRGVASKVQDARNFQTFLTEYRERLKTKTLSELFSDPAPIGAT